MRTQCVHYTYYANGNDRLKTETSDVNPAVTYTYDNNGSMTSKAVAGATTLHYAYNVAQRLVKLTLLPGGHTWHSYTYNDRGIRTSHYAYWDGSSSMTYYHIDPNNPTGYAQVFEELDSGYTPTMTYTIGDDLLSQGSTTDVYHFGYDGHGSTRLLLASDGSIAANYAYDAYGNVQGSDPGYTKYLYAGEQYDASLGMTYLRERYYDSANGTFNRMDPFQGDPFAPQSLHKYAYVWNNPVNVTDPTGMAFDLSTLSITMMISGIIIGATGIGLHIYGRITDNDFLATVGMEAIIVGIALLSGGGLVGAGVLTGAEASVLQAIVSAVTIVYTHSGQILGSLIGRKIEVQKMMNNLVSTGTLIPSHGVIIFENKANNLDLVKILDSGTLSWSNPPVSYRLDDRVLEYWIVGNGFKFNFAVKDVVDIRPNNQPVFRDINVQQNQAINAQGFCYQGFNWTVINKEGR